MLKTDSSSFFVTGALFHGLISLLNLAIDYPILSGDEGLLPDVTWLNGLSETFGFDVILKYFPSLLFLLPAKVLIHLGIIVAITGIAFTHQFPVYGRIVSFVVYLILLSFSGSRGVLLWFPWDCLLFETLFISFVSPDSQFLKRLLLFRVMFGFGKHKFLGADSWDDLTYTQSMACWQPLGSSIGWYLSSLPSAIHIVSILLTFLAEMVAPFIILFPSRFSESSYKYACWSIILLMFMIQIAGHFGWFNSLTSVLAISLLPSHHSPILTNHPSLMRRSARLVYIILSLIFLIPSQWNSPSMFYQHTFDSPQWDIVRIVSSWRILHTYGVFPPKKMPMIKPVGQFQITLENFPNDPIDLEYYYQSTPSSDPISLDLFPFLVAPFRFPRFDYIYGFYSASHVFSLTTRLGPIIGTGEEYIDSVANMLLTNSGDIGQYFKNPHTILKNEKISSVKFFILGLVPNWNSGKWDIVSRHLDKPWFSNDLLSPNIHLLSSNFLNLFPPNMVVIRKQALKTEHPLDAAIRRAEQVDSNNDFGSERVWLSHVSYHYFEITGQQLFSFGHPDDDSSPRRGLYDLQHASTFAGYIGCLTFAHLVPYPIHSPLCLHVLSHNFKSRQGDNEYSKIPVEKFVYQLLGFSKDDLLHIS